MTGLERVGAALQGRFADRRAATATLSLYGARLAGIALSRYYRDPEAYRLGQAAVVERFDPDIVFAPFALALEAEACGAGLAFFDKAPPNVRKPATLEGFLGGAAEPGAEEAGSFDAARFLDEPGPAYLLESIRLLARDNAGSRPVAAILTCPCDLPALVFGLDAWLETLLFDPPRAETLLAAAERRFLALAEACAEAGAMFAAMPVMFAQPKIIGEELVKAQIIPYISRVFARAPCPLVFHHGANPLGEILALFKELPGIAGFAMDERDDFRRARSVLGPGPLLLGGVNGPLVEGRGPERLRSMVAAVREATADDPRYVFATGAADLPYDTDPGHIDALLGAARA